MCESHAPSVRLGNPVTVCNNIVHIQNYNVIKLLKNLHTYSIKKVNNIINLMQV
jgi:hypothetical protein